MKGTPISSSSTSQPELDNRKAPQGPERGTVGPVRDALSQPGSSPEPLGKNSKCKTVGRAGPIRVIEGQEYESQSQGEGPKGQDERGATDGDFQALSHGGHQTDYLLKGVDETAKHGNVLAPRPELLSFSSHKKKATGEEVVRRKLSQSQEGDPIGQDERDPDAVKDAPGQDVVPPRRGTIGADKAFYLCQFAWELLLGSNRNVLVKLDAYRFTVVNISADVCKIFASFSRRLHCMNDIHSSFLARHQIFMIHDEDGHSHMLFSKSWLRFAQFVAHAEKKQVFGVQLEELKRLYSNPDINVNSTDQTIQCKTCRKFGADCLLKNEHEVTGTQCGIDGDLKDSPCGGHRKDQLSKGIDDEDCNESKGSAKNEKVLAPRPGFSSPSSPKRKAPGDEVVRRKFGRPNSLYRHSWPRAAFQDDATDDPFRRSKFEQQNSKDSENLDSRSKTDIDRDLVQALRDVTNLPDRKHETTFIVFPAKNRRHDKPRTRRAGRQQADRQQGADQSNPSGQPGQSSQDSQPTTPSPGAEAYPQPGTSHSPQPDSGFGVTGAVGGVESSSTEQLKFPTQESQESQQAAAAFSAIFPYQSRRPGPREQGLGQAVAGAARSAPKSNAPRYPRYADAAVRRVSFDSWPKRGQQDPEALVTYGFFYTGQIDLVRCYMCGIGLKDWDSPEEPLFEHIKHSPDCVFLLHLLGPNLLDAYKANLLPGRTQHQEARTQAVGGTNVGGTNVEEFLATPAPQASIRSPQFSSMPARLSSFSRWPVDLVQTPMLLAQAGFYYTGFGDVVRCYACDGGLQRWDPQDDPWVEHTRWFPQCYHIRTTKGDSYVELVQRAIAATSSDDEVPEASPIQLSVDPAVGPTDSVLAAIEGLSIDQNGRSFAEQQQERERVDPIYTAAAQSVIAVGYSVRAVRAAMQQLQEAGTTSLKAEDIMQIVLQMEDSGTLPPDSPTLGAAESQLQQEAPRPGNEDDPGYLQHENLRLKNIVKCMICHIRNTNVLFLPCTHHRVCQECSLDLHQCPECRREIKSKVKTYMS